MGVAPTTKISQKFSPRYTSAYNAKNHADKFAVITCYSPPTLLPAWQIRGKLLASLVGISCRLCVDAIISHILRWEDPIKFKSKLYCDYTAYASNASTGQYTLPPRRVVNSFFPSSIREVSLARVRTRYFQGKENRVCRRHGGSHAYPVLSFRKSVGVYQTVLSPFSRCSPCG